MTLLAAWSEIVADWAPSFPSSAPSVARAPGPGRLGLRGPTLSVAHHLDPGPPAAQLEQRVLSPLALSLGTADLVLRACGAVLCPICPGRLWASPSTTPAAQDRPRHSPGALSPRSPFAPLHVT